MNRTVFVNTQYSYRIRLGQTHNIYQQYVFHNLKSENATKYKFPVASTKLTQKPLKISLYHFLSDVQQVNFITASAQLCAYNYHSI